MVFFVCEGCNESLKKNQVDKHAMRCRNCYAVTCVDCNVTFYEDDYRSHTTCISEAEKYEGALYRPQKDKGSAGGDGSKPKKRSAQELWMDLVEAMVADASKAPTALREILSGLGGYGNVPRNEKKFANFVKNSLNVRSDGVIKALWAFLSERHQEQQQQQQQKAEVEVAKAHGENKDDSARKSGEKDTNEVEEKKEGKKEKKSKEKKNKKRKHSEHQKAGSESTKASKMTTEASAASSSDDTKELKEKKQKKKKKKKKKEKCEGRGEKSDEAKVAMKEDKAKKRRKKNEVE